MKPLSILLLNTYDRASGAEKLASQTAHFLAKRGHQVRFYVKKIIDPAPSPLTRSLGDRDLSLRLESGWRRITGLNDLFFRGSWRLMSHPDFINADIVHAFNLHGHYFSLPSLIPISHRKPFIWSPVDIWPITGGCAYPKGCLRYRVGCGRCPYVNIIYPDLTRDTTWLMSRFRRGIYRKSKIHFLLHTNWLYERYREVLGERAWIRKLNYGVDLDEFYPVDKIPARRHFGLPDDPNVFCVGLFHSYLMDERKGLIQLALRLGQRLHEFRRPLHFLVAGHQAEEFRNHIVKHFPLNMTITGYLIEDKLRQAYGAIDVLVFPTKEENMALTAINAMACSVPVISSRAGGQVELITDGRDGFLTPIGDEDGMVDKIFWLATHPEVCQDIGREARRTVLKYFNIHHYIEGLEELYFRLYNK
jgi:glycosyltransferase involved in cell wall biosynthesis